MRGVGKRKDGRMVRGTLSSARYDGRCVVETSARERVNVMAHALVLVHRGVGARIT